jgi:hypothetical protein
MAKKFDLGQIVAILANIGVIASLVFVGVQVQQGATATRSATVLQLKDAWVQLNLASATSVDLATAFQAINEKGWNGASFGEKELVTAFYRTLFHNWSNAYYQYQNETLDENQWGAYIREARWNVENPNVRLIWTEWNHVYDDSFRTLMDNLIAETGAQTQSGVE